MKGLVFDLSIPKYVLAKGMGGMYPKLHYGRGSSLSLRELASPTLPGPDWVWLRPLLTGLCGSDMGTLFFKMSPQSEPFNRFPPHPGPAGAHGGLRGDVRLHRERGRGAGLTALHALAGEGGAGGGAAGILERVDWTTVGRNELTLLGSYVYGPESLRGVRQHTFDLVLELLARREGPDPSMLVTHTFPLARYQEAIEANLARASHQSVKTVFELTVNP